MFIMAPVGPTSTITRLTQTFRVAVSKIEGDPKENLNQGPPPMEHCGAKEHRTTLPRQHRKHRTQRKESIFFLQEHEEDVRFHSGRRIPGVARPKFCRTYTFTSGFRVRVRRRQEDPSEEEFRQYKREYEINAEWVVNEAKRAVRARQSG